MRPWLQQFKKTIEGACIHTTKLCFLKSSTWAWAGTILPSHEIWHSHSKRRTVGSGTQIEREKQVGVGFILWNKTLSFSFIRSQQGIVTFLLIFVKWREGIESFDPAIQGIVSLQIYNAHFSSLKRELPVSPWIKFRKYRPSGSRILTTQYLISSNHHWGSCCHRELRSTFYIRALLTFLSTFSQLHSSRQ